MTTCGPANPRQLTFFAEVTHAQNTAALEVTATANTPTSPVTFSAWSDDSALDGWSARMFLHQLLIGSRQHWKSSDTDALLSASTPRRLRASLGSGISLSGVIRLPGANSREPSFRTARMVRGLIRRALARGRSLRLLLRTEHDTIPVIVTFGPKGTDYASWKAKSASDLPDSLTTGLLDFLRRHAPPCSATH